MSDETQQPVATPAIHPLGDSHEGKLLRGLDKAAQNRGVVRLHLSRLQDENRQNDDLLSAETSFEALTRTRSAWLYRLRNTDLMVIFEKSETTEVEKSVVKLLKLWGSDDLMKRFKTDPRKNRLSSWFDMAADYDKLIAFAERQAASFGGRKKKTLEELIAEKEMMRQKSERGHPLTPSELARVEESLAQVDLSSHTRRQPVCAFIDGDQPEVVFTEVFVSIGDLRETLMPNTDMTANPWLFQRLTQTLDKRVLAQMSRRDDRTLMREGFSINLNVGTIMSEEFLAFDSDINPSTQEAVLELRLEDIFSDPNGFAFARDFLTERGYHICIDGLTLDTFPYADPARLGVTYGKLNWSSAIAGMVGTEHGENLKAMIMLRKRGRTILSRCDSEAAIRVGRQMGITLFQGRYVDSMMRERY
jgi:EAL domain-containing protein (putative c-di-GMP-specific phosphodiesterase class I)